MLTLIIILIQVYHEKEKMGQKEKNWRNRDTDELNVTAKVCVGKEIVREISTIK